MNDALFAQISTITSSLVGPFNLDNILADNKKEQASKISGYMEIVYPDAVEFLYLKHIPSFSRSILPAAKDSDARQPKQISFIIHCANQFLPNWTTSAQKGSSFFRAASPILPTEGIAA